ncbi:MAG TPA: histidine kinase [Candidatus Dormibacteraeota bacterium]|nr:histidine kinase [Candidatus Dormibacteraeota bacterium]
MYFSDAAAPLRLVAVLEAVALIALLIAALSGLRVSRRQAGRLAAIDFVRATFALRLAQGERLEELLPQVVRALGHAFALDAAEIWQVVDSGLVLTASEPGRDATLPRLPPIDHVLARAPVSGTAWAGAWLPELIQEWPEATLRVAPLVQDDRLLGLIVVARAHGGWRLAAEADMTLEELAREVGLAIQKAEMDAALRGSLRQLQQQADDLSASRIRIVLAGDAERRRIERNLHDGAQQYLVALGVKVRLLERLLERDPAGAREIGEELADDVERAIDALRNLARGIYPVLLARGGLVPALAEACRRAGVSARLEASAALPRQSAEVEAAVYFCCVEALQNVARHAGPHAKATVRVWQADGALRFEVVDDGHGFAARGAEHGAGLTNMGDRLGALGGSLAVESAPGDGTRVRGEVPVRTSDERLQA